MHALILVGTYVCTLDVLKSSTASPYASRILASLCFSHIACSDILRRQSFSPEDTRTFVMLPGLLTVGLFQKKQQNDEFCCRQLNSRGDM